MEATGRVLVRDEHAEHPMAKPAAEARPLPFSEEKCAAWRIGIQLAVDDFKNAQNGDCFGEAQGLLTISIATILESAGESMDPPKVRSPMPFEAGYFVFTANGRTYKFRSGRFPEYDMFMDRFRARERATHALAVESQPTDLSAQWQAGSIDPELAELILARAMEASALVTP